MKDPIKKAAKDFPDWFGPMLVKELRQGLRARGFVITFVGLQVIFVIMMVYHALLYARDPRGFSTSGMNGFFWTFVGLQLLAVTPLRALGGLANERKANTLELIFMTGLTPWRICWGKWASLMFQACLFLLAILPFAFLRYFFGGVNLIEELSVLGIMFLVCGLLTALALMVSGFPIVLRVIAFCVIGFFMVSILPVMAMSMAFRGMGGGSMVGTVTFPWYLMIYDVVVLTLLALSVASSCVAPPAENHALRQRLLLLALWLPAPVLILMNLGEMALAQVVFFAALTCIFMWQHLAVIDLPLRTHVEAFTKRGRGWIVPAVPFLPGWPSAVIFTAIAGALILLPVLLQNQVGPAGFQIKQNTVAIVTMVIAALLTPTIFFRVIRRRSRFLLLEHTIFLGVCAALYSFLQVAMDVSLGDLPILAVVPPLGLAAMLTGMSEQPMAWATAGVIACVVTLLLAALLSIPYWRHVGVLVSRVRKERTAAKVLPEQEVAA